MKNQDQQHLTPGKYRRLRRLCDAEGRFAMLAIDQRGSLRRMIAKQKGGAPDDVDEQSLRVIKRIVTEVNAPLATAVLTDPLYGYPASHDVIPQEVGVLLACEVTGYEASDADERLSRLIDGWDVNDGLREGADAIKLLLWHHPDASEETHRHQQAIVEQVGAACAEAQLPFLLEIVTYDLDGNGRNSAPFARIKAELVIDAARIYSEKRFQVDLLKLEFPANLKYAREYQGRSFSAGEVVATLDDVREACRLLDEAAGVPWVILSAGVDPEEFIENIRLANAAGASGFLCGRAVWKHVVDYYPDEAAMRAFMEEQGQAHFRRIREANEEARPWHRHEGLRAASPEAVEATL